MTEEVEVMPEALEIEETGHTTVIDSGLQDLLDDSDLFMNMEIATGDTYRAFIKQFGASLIDKALIERFEKVTGHKAHKFLRRGLFFSHRDLEKILDAYEAKETIYLYTGRGPSSDSLHIGHTIPFIFTKWLQDALNAVLVIQITDDEKFLRDTDLSLADTHHFAMENIKDIIACGFNVEKTFIFIDTEYIQYLYPRTCQVNRYLSANLVKKCFGFEDDSSNIGYLAFPGTQMAPCFPDTFPHIFGGLDQSKIRCFIPMGCEQDVYFRLVRDISEKLGCIKPAVIHSKFIPSLTGGAKMSASSKNQSVYLTDTPKEIAKKIKKHAFSGGRETLAEHRKYGADLSVDVSIKYLEVFLEDDAQLEDIKEKYGSGDMTTGEVKAILIEVLQKLVADHQERRKDITDEVVREFTKIRPLAL
jgi:tryptophanyl-tRNA synthetase